MIIVKTPFRVSLFGWNCFPKYYLNNGGYVIGGSIDKFSYVTADFCLKYLIINIELFGQK